MPSQFASKLIAWQAAHGRHDLPWQATRDPYRIWLAEVMLQQTQVATVLPYFGRFLEHFPDVESLAAASIDAVMTAWAGLGYYSRARNLHHCAQLIVARHGGRFPDSAEALAELPGIGRSTAAAIVAFAHGTRAAILDGNVKRVMARHFGIDGYPGESVVERQLWRLAESQLPDADVGAYTQGLMDLGAMVCTRRAPRCDACPVRASCVALRDGRVAELPKPRPARARPVREAAVAVIRDPAGSVLFERRAPTGVWGGLLSAPEFDVALTDAELERAIEQRYGVQVETEGRVEAVRHDFTHFTLVIHPRLVRVVGSAAVSEGGAIWCADVELGTAPLPAPMRRIVLALARRGSAAAVT